MALRPNLFVTVYTNTLYMVPFEVTSTDKMIFRLLVFGYFESSFPSSLAIGNAMDD